MPQSQLVSNQSPVHAYIAHSEPNIGPSLQSIILTESNRTQQSRLMSTNPSQLNRRDSSRKINVVSNSKRSTDPSPQHVKLNPPNSEYRQMLKGLDRKYRDIMEQKLQEIYNIHIDESNRLSAFVAENSQRISSLNQSVQHVFNQISRQKQGNQEVLRYIASNNDMLGNRTNDCSARVQKLWEVLRELPAQILNKTVEYSVTIVQDIENKYQKTLQAKLNEHDSVVMQWKARQRFLQDLSSRVKVILEGLNNQCAEIKRQVQGQLNHQQTHLQRNQQSLVKLEYQLNQTAFQTNQFERTVVSQLEVVSNRQQEGLFMTKQLLNQAGNVSFNLLASLQERIRKGEKIIHNLREKCVSLIQTAQFLQSEQRKLGNMGLLSVQTCVDMLAASIKARESDDCELRSIDYSQVKQISAVKAENMQLKGEIIQLIRKQDLFYAKIQEQRQIIVQCEVERKQLLQVIQTNQKNQGFTESENGRQIQLFKITQKRYLNQIQKMGSRIQQLQNDHSCLKGNLNSSQDKIQTLNNQLNGSKSTLTVKQQQIEALNRQTQVLQLEHTRQIEQLTQDYLEELKPMQEKLEELQKERASWVIKSQGDSKSNILSPRSTSQTIRLQAQVKQQSQDIELLQNSLLAARDKLIVYDEQNKVLNLRVQQLESSLEAAYDNFERQSNQFKKMISQLMLENKSMSLK